MGGGKEGLDGVRVRAGGRVGGVKEVRVGADGNEKYSKLGRSEAKTVERGRERREKHSNGRTEGGMYVEVDGWIVHGKYIESRAEEKKGKKREACQPMFSESVYPPSWRPVTGYRNNLIAVCWAHTNQGTGMCTLSSCFGSRQTFHKS